MRPRKHQCRWCSQKFRSAGGRARHIEEKRRQFPEGDIATRAARLFFRLTHRYSPHSSGVHVPMPGRILRAGDSIAIERRRQRRAA